MDEVKIAMTEYYLKKRCIPRFPPDLDQHEEAEVRLYFRNHAISALSRGSMWDGQVENLGWGIKTIFRNVATPGVDYTSIYVFRSHRGKSQMGQYIESHRRDATFCTAPSCEIQNYFESKGAKYVLIEPCSFKEYALVRRYYGDSVTDRTGIHMINHIDEGLFVLNEIGASDLAKRAYILHPLLQSDEDLAAFWESNGPEVIDGRVLGLTMEYRNIANAHLSHHPAGVDAFLLSPLKDVNDMLIADKVQNRKDFELYHETSHTRSARLAEYFKEWLQKLGFTEDRYADLKSKIIERTGGLVLAKEACRPSNNAPIATEEQPGFKQVPSIITKKTEA